MNQPCLSKLTRTAKKEPKACAPIIKITNQFWKYNLLSLLSFLLLFSCQPANKTDNLENQKEPAKPKNVILMIGDGMGIAHLQAAMTINKGDLQMKRFKQIALVTTHSADDYVTDSGAAGSAIASGQKTNNGHISISPLGDTLITLAELAKFNSLGAGLVTTCAITHATPAAFYAHQFSRNSYEAIASDFIKSEIDVIIGGGRAHFETREDGLNLIDQLRAKNYQVVYDIQGMNEVNPGKLAALLWENHPPSILEGRNDYLTPASLKAIELLEVHENGFFLMIESSQIDWGGHERNIDYILSETLEFDSLIGIILDFVETDGETLLVLTADHETGGLSLEQGSYESGELETAFSTEHHTGIMVPLFAFGPGAEKFTGFMDNTDIFQLIVELLQLTYPQPINIEQE